MFAKTKKPQHSKLILNNNIYTVYRIGLFSCFVIFSCVVFAEKKQWLPEWSAGDPVSCIGHGASGVQYLRCDSWFGRIFVRPGVVSLVATRLTAMWKPVSLLWWRRYYFQMPLKLLLLPACTVRSFFTCWGRNLERIHYNTGWPANKGHT